MEVIEAAATVIICTRNRATALERCLESLSDDSSVAAVEVIVVDNDSSDGTLRVINRAISRSRRPMRLVREPMAGLSYARNTGVREARAELLLFTDDDVVVQDGWIDGLLAAFEPDVVAVGGRVIPTFPIGRPDWVLDAPNFLTLYDEGTAPFEMGDSALPAGANMAIRRTALPAGDQPFSIELGSAASLSVGGEDVYAMQCLRGRGRIVYTPHAVVEHPFDDPVRLTCQWARRRSFVGGIGNARYTRLMGADRLTAWRRFELTVRALRYLYRTQRRNARHGRVDPTATQDEFRACWTAGRQLETLSPRLARWCANRFF